MKCPTCSSPDPKQHPATQSGGEVAVICKDQFHYERKAVMANAENISTEVDFALFGLDRTMPVWVEPQWDKPVLHLGPGEKHIENTVEYDWPEWDFDKLGFDAKKWLEEHNEYDTSKTELPHMKESVGGVIATHVLEHLKDPRPLLREVSRILAPGAPFNILVPHGQSLMFLQDLDHRTPFVTETWKTLLSNPYYEKEHQGFSFRIGANFLFGIKEANLSLVTQLIKE